MWTRSRTAGSHGGARKFPSGAVRLILESWSFSMPIEAHAGASEAYSGAFAASFEASADLSGASATYSGASVALSTLTS
jgi:hypothetical protein